MSPNSTSTSSNPAPVFENIKPIEWYTLRYWVRETLVFDQREYKRKSRPLNLKRFFCLFKPNLKQPIFVVGAPRSGTTFLGQCLAELPEISYHFEPVIIKAATHHIYTNQWSMLRILRFYKRVYGWLMRLYLDADLRLADKTPRNSLIIPTLYNVFPDARFIFIQRDGRDAALSLAKKPWYQNELKGKGIKEPAGYIFGPQARFWVEPERAKEFEGTSNIHRCIWIWRQYVEHIVEAKKNIPEKQFYELRYEDLVTQPLEEATKLLNFLNINNHDSRKIFTNFLEKKASPNSIGTWKKELSLEQLQQIDQEAGELLRSLNYIDYHDIIA